ncbi:MAG: TIGR03857 family LLM class F420-dependent oxidoreductase [Sporichthyaceae bacterium]
MADLPTEIPELGIYMLPGRIKDPARALSEAVQAEALGLRTAWLAERYDIKEMGVLCGAMAARTERIKIGMGSIAMATRHPLMTAAMCATMQQTFGNRTVVSLARGLDDVTTPHGMAKYTLADFEDYCGMLLDLWAGKTVTYRGPIGNIPAAKLADPLTAPRPEMTFSSWVPGPKGIALTAKMFDGIILGSELTADACRNSVDQLRKACVDIGRDPATLKVYAIVITAPDLTPEEENLVVNARILTHLGFAGVGNHIMKANQWDPEIMTGITADLEGADQKFHRSQLVEMAAALPRQWVETSCVVGDNADCVRRLHEYLDAGVDEIILHGCAPHQIGGLIEEWRRTPRTSGGTA